MTPDDLDASDTLLVKADALIHRHRSGSTHAPDDDLPVLEDVVGEDLPVLEDIAAPAEPTVAAPPAAAQPDYEARLTELESELAVHREMLAHKEAACEAALSRANLAEELARHASASAQVSRMAVAEHLIDLDAHIAQTLEAWINEELPQLIAGELEGAAERLRVKAIAHMRATLVPDLSSKLSEVLDDTVTNISPGL